MHDCGQDCTLHKHSRAANLMAVLLCAGSFKHMHHALAINFWPVVSADTCFFLFQDCAALYTVLKPLHKHSHACIPIYMVWCVF